MKIPFKTIGATLIITTLCLTPYAIYKHQTFVPNSFGTTFTFGEKHIPNVIDAIKIVTVQNTILGHSSIKVTMDFYARVRPRKLMEAVKKFDVL